MDPKANERFNDMWGKSASGAEFDAPAPPPGTVPQASYKDGSASQLNMQVRGAISLPLPLSLSLPRCWSLVRIIPG